MNREQMEAWLAIEGWEPIAWAWSAPLSNGLQNCQYGVVKRTAGLMPCAYTYEVGIEYCDTDSAAIRECRDTDDGDAQISGEISLTTKLLEELIRFIEEKDHGKLE